MDDKTASMRTVTVTEGDPRFAFHVDVPAEWAQADLPDEEPDFSDDSFQPLGVFAARYGIMILTFSVRPAFEEGTVAQWLARMGTSGGIEFNDIGPAQAGGIQGVGALGTQQSEGGEMTVRVLLFEQGGWAHLLMGMAPSVVWDSLASLYDRMFDSFAMETVLPATVPPWPDQETPGPLGEWDLDQAREAAERFLQAIQSGDEPAARALLSEDDGTVSFPSMGEGEASFELGQAQADGDKAVVPATLRALPPGETEMQEQVMPLVLVQADGLWKVDMNASIERMLGGDLMEGLKGAAEQMGRGLAEGLDKLMEGLGEAFGGGEASEDPADDKS